MKDIGIIGGAGPEAGILLANQIIRLCQQKYSCKRDKDFPYLALFSFPFSEMLEEENFLQVSSELKKIIQEECSNVSHWAIACNTLHGYLNFDFPQEGFINMLEETANHVYEKPVIFCSSRSKSHGIHQRYFDCNYPEKKEQTSVDKLIDILVAKNPTEFEFKEFSEILSVYQSQPIVLGCTEFSLLNYFYPLKGTLIDPMKIVAEKLCKSFFEKKHVSS